MPDNRQLIEVSGVAVEVIRKRIRNMHLRVYSTDGAVRVSVPMRLSENAIREAVMSRLEWIRRRQEIFAGRGPRDPRRMVTGESLNVQGRRYRLEVIERNGPQSIEPVDDTTLEMRVRPGSDTERREAVLHDWYRQLLRRQIPELIAKWEPLVGVRVEEWGIKRMKTRWGSCNTHARRIWLNLALAEKPVECLEYVVLHEMVHLLERNHGARFKGYMSGFMPEWKEHRNELKKFPIQHDMEYGI